jgi:hypothetical protein
MSTPDRCGKKWSVTEVLSLQREYELLGLSLSEIAKLHSRSVSAIQYKLVNEEFATWDELTTPTNSVVDTPENTATFDTDTELSNLTDRVWSLETSVSDISAMVKQMFTSIVHQKNSVKNTTNRRSLRSHL